MAAFNGEKIGDIGESGIFSAGLALGQAKIGDIGVNYNHEETVVNAQNSLCNNIKANKAR
ncbi:MAG: hypothetical protein AB8B66_05420 [Rickettsiaceae bacterium]